MSTARLALSVPTWPVMAAATIATEICSFEESEGDSGDKDVKGEEMVEDEGWS